MYTGFAGNNKTKLRNKGQTTHSLVSQSKGKEMRECVACPLISSAPKHSNCDSTTALGLLGGLKSLDLRVIAKHFDDGIAQSSRSRTVNNSHLGKLCQAGFVQKLVYPIDSLVDSATQQVDFVGLDFL